MQHRMTTCGGHIRKLANAQKAVEKAIELYNNIQNYGFKT
jgi:hypothetical protein